MNLEWFDDFVSLCETRNFSRSAELRNSTQSALSRRIKALECWVGTELFDRSTYPVDLTDAGRVFRDAAMKISQEIASARLRAVMATGRIEASIIFAATHMMSQAFVPDWIGGLTTELGPLSVRLDCLPAGKCIQAVETGHAHFAICPMPLRPLDEHILPDRVESVVLKFDEMVPVSLPDAAGDPQFRLCGGGDEAVPFLGLAQGSLLGGAVRRMIGERSHPPHLRISFESPLKEAIKGMVLNGQGLAWLPRLIIAEELENARLVPAGGPEWNVGYEIKLIRSTSEMPAPPERLWSYLNLKSTPEERILVEA